MNWCCIVNACLWPWPQMHTPTDLQGLCRLRQSLVIQIDVPLRMPAFDCVVTGVHTYRPAGWHTVWRNVVTIYIDSHMMYRVNEYNVQDVCMGFFYIKKPHSDVLGKKTPKNPKQTNYIDIPLTMPLTLTTGVHADRPSWWRTVWRNVVTIYIDVPLIMTASDCGHRCTQRQAFMVTYCLTECGNNIHWCSIDNDCLWLWSQVYTPTGLQDDVQSDRVWRRNDTHDDAARAAFEAVIYVSVTETYICLYLLSLLACFFLFVSLLRLLCLSLFAFVCLFVYLRLVCLLVVFVRLFSNVFSPSVTNITDKTWSYFCVYILATAWGFCVINVIKALRYNNIRYDACMNTVSVQSFRILCDCRWV